MNLLFLCRTIAAFSLEGVGYSVWQEVVLQSFYRLVRSRGIFCKILHLQKVQTIKQNFIHPGSHLHFKPFGFPPVFSAFYLA